MSDRAPRPFPAFLAGAGGLYGAGGVAAAAAAAHRVSDPLLATSSNFLMLHAAALVALAAAASAGPGRLLVIPGWILAFGALLFCGDLALRALSGASPLPLAAPVGGSLLIVGWLGVAVGAAIFAMRRAPD